MAKKIWETKWMRDLLDGVYGPRKGGARIIIDAQNAATGVGKTGLAVSLAQLLSKAFDYELKEEDLTLSSAEYLQRWKEHPDKEQPSVMILDELSGGGAADSRRAMSTSNVNLGRSWELMRKKRCVTITTLPHWSDADKKMRRLADYRLWCLDKPIGYFRPYQIGTDFEQGDVMPKSYSDVERIRFPNMDKHGAELYNYLADRKDDLLDSDHFNADEVVDTGVKEEEITPDEAVNEKMKEIAQQMRANGKSLRQIASNVGRSHTWVSDHTSEPAQSD